VVKETEYDAVTGNVLETIEFTLGHDEIAQTVTEYDGGGNVTSTVTRTYGHDGHGSVRAAIDLAAAMSQLYAFAAYGQLMGIHNGAGQFNSSDAADADDPPLPGSTSTPASSSNTSAPAITTRPAGSSPSLIRLRKRWRPNQPAQVPVYHANPIMGSIRQVRNSASSVSSAAIGISESARSEDATAGVNAPHDPQVTKLIKVYQKVMKYTTRSATFMSGFLTSLTLWTSTGKTLTNKEQMGGLALSLLPNIPLTKEIDCPRKPVRSSSNCTERLFGSS
jgi:hypothetical protein